MVVLQVPGLQLPGSTVRSHQLFASLLSEVPGTSGIVLSYVADRPQNVGVSLSRSTKQGAGYRIRFDLLHVAQRTLNLHHMRVELYSRLSNSKLLFSLVH